MKFVIVIEWLLGLWGAFALYVALVCGIAFFDASTFSFALIAVLELLRKKQQTSPK